MFKFLKCTSFFLIIVGAINWGMIGLFGFDLVAYLFGDMSFLTRLIYGLVGFAGVISPVLWRIQMNHCYCSND